MMVLISLLVAFGQDEGMETGVVMVTGPDRSGVPAVREPAPLDLSEPEEHALSNGLPVRYVQVPRLRDVSVRLTWWRGANELVQSGLDPYALELMSDLWGVASEQYDPAALSELEDVNDLVVYAGVYDHSTAVSLEVPKEKLGLGLDLMADVALHPTFPKREVQLSQEETERWYTADAVKSPGNVAAALSSFAWFPADHPYGRRPDVDATTSVKHKDLPALHQAAIAAGPASLVVVGDLPWSDIGPELESRFGAIPVGGERAEHLELPALQATQVYAVDMPASEQASIHLRLTAPARDDEDAVALRASTWALGGHFLSRFNENLREDKGWTYGVRTVNQANPSYGYFRVKVDVPADKLAPAVTELERELAEVVGEGVTEDELKAWWRGEVKGFNDTRGTLRSASGFYGSLDAHQESVADRVGRLSAVEAVDRETARAAAERWFADDAPRSWVVVGPRSVLESGFSELGWEPVWLEASDAVLGRLPVGGTP